MNNKLCIAILIAATTFTSSVAQRLDNKKYSSLLQEGVKGNVRIAEISRFTIDTLNLLATQDSCCFSRTEYDKNGRSIKTERLTVSGIFQGGIYTKYHSNGLIKKISFLNKDRKETAYENYFINDNGAYTGGEGYDEGKLLRRFKISDQNEFGQWTKLIWYSLDGKIYREEKYTYEENRKIAEVWKEYKDDPNGIIAQDMIYKYNERGERILQQGIHSYLGLVNEVSNRIFEYDKYGNWIQYIILNSSGKPTRMFKRKLTYR